MVTFNPTRQDLGPDRTVYGSEPIQPVLSLIADYLGVLMRHEEHFYQNIRDAFNVGGNSLGDTVYRRNLHFKYRSLIFDNPSGFNLYIPELFTIVPANTYGYLVSCDTPLEQVTVNVLNGTQAATVVCYVRVSERPVVVGTIQTAITVALSSASPSLIGAPNAVVGNAVAGAAAQLVAARSTRVGINIVNEDTFNSIRISPLNTVSTTVGELIGPLASQRVSYRSAIFFAAVAGTPAVSYWDEYN